MIKLARVTLHSENTETEYTLGKIKRRKKHQNEIIRLNKSTNKYRNKKNQQTVFCLHSNCKYSGFIHCNMENEGFILTVTEAAVI